jgi:hypothetical protein
MTSISWTATSSGTWSTASNWSGGVAPQTGDDVTIDTGSALTVTYNAGNLALDSLTVATATLSVTGGTLAVYNGYQISSALNLSAGELSLTAGNDGNFLGAVDLTGGNLVLSGGATARGSLLSENAGTITVTNGIFYDAEAGTLSGLINGFGQLDFDSAPGTITLNKGFALNTGSVVVGGLLGPADVAFNESLSYANPFTESQNSVISLNGNTLTLSGLASLNGDITAGGVVNASGTGHFSGLDLDNGLLLNDSGSYVAVNTVTLGNTGSGTISIAKGGTLNLATNSNIVQGAGGGEILNSGLLAKTGGTSSGGTTTISTAFANSATGTVNVAVGTLDFAGPSSGFTNTLGGTIEGVGSVALSSGSFLISSATSLNLDVARVLLDGPSTGVTLITALTYDGNWDQTGGTLVVGSPGVGTGSLTLGGLVSLDDGLLKGTGTVLGLATGDVHLGNGIDIEGNLTLTFDGPVSQTGVVNLGLQTGAIVVANVAAGNTWALNGATDINGFNGEINNGGTFVKASGAGDSVVQSDVINTGTLAVDAGALTLSGVGTLGGLVTGPAALDISGAFQFSSGLTLSVGEVVLEAPNLANEVQASLDGNLSFANGWAQEGGTLQLNGNTLTLTGVASLLSGAIVDPGELLATGHALLGNGLNVLQGADITLNGTAEQSGSVTLTGGSTAPTITVGSSGTYTMDAGANLGGANNSVVGTLVVDGTVQAAGASYFGTATNVIDATVVDSGKILLSHGDFQFLGPLTGAGVLSVSNGATLELLGSGAVSTGVTFGAGDSVLTLGTPADFTGKITGFHGGDLIELQGFAFSSGGTEATFAVVGNTVVVTDANSNSDTLTFSTAQTATSLTLVEGAHNSLALYHL